MRRGGWDPDEGNDPPRPVQKEVPVTPVMKVLHPVTRAVIGVGFFAGGTISLFTWDWRYFVASLGLGLAALFVGPWVWPHEKVRIEVDEAWKPDLEGYDG